MSDTAVGPLTGGVLGLESLLASSEAFSTRAADKIYLFDYFQDDPEILKDARPFAAIWPADILELQEISGGAKYFLEPGGELCLLLTDYDRHPGQENRRESGLDFAGWVDRVLLEIADLAGDGDHLPIREIRLLRTMAHSHPKDAPAAGEFWHCAFLVRWK